MSVIGQQIIKIFQQYSPHEEIDILHWTTNLTFETIGKVGFGYGEPLLGTFPCFDLPANTKIRLPSS